MAGNRFASRTRAPLRAAFAVTCLVFALFFVPGQAIGQAADGPSARSDSDAARESADPVSPPAAAAENSASGAVELNFNRTLVIEGKVEKPQVTFTLLKEPPPEKEIRFEASFRENILELERENTFVPGETYGRD